MNGRASFDVAIATWLDEEARDGAPERLIDATRRELLRTNQRRAAWPAWRLSQMNMRIAVAAAAIVVAVVGAYLILPRQTGPGVDASPAPTASPTPTQTPVAVVGDALLQPGRYSFEPFETNAPGLRVNFTVPSGWSSFAGFALLSPRGTTEPSGSGIGFLAASTLFSDPCHWGTNPRVGDIAIGPSVDDLATALASQTAYTSTAPTDTVLDGYAGKIMEIHSPDIDIRATCDRLAGIGTYWLWATNEACDCNIYVQGPGERRMLRILDVEGERIVVFNNYYDGTSPADRAEAQAIIDSITIEP